MAIHVLSADLPLPDLFDGNGLLKLLPAADYDQISPDALRLWCHRHARYGLPTQELVAWLQERIAGRAAIEIGSGCGDLARVLGIPATDNRMQEWLDVQLFYRITGQPLIRYHECVQTLDALDAVKKHRPEVVVASWVTEWIDPSLPSPPHGGNMYGVKENQILAAGCEYILIGNIGVHGHKKIMAIQHQEFTLPFLRSRAIDPTLNRIWIWNAGDKERRLTPQA